MERHPTSLWDDFLP